MPTSDRVPTIFALATGRRRAAIAVVRISGPDAHQIVGRLTAGAKLEMRRARLCKLIDPLHGGVLDEALVLPFAADASFTGEDSAELHLHGGLSVISAVETVLERLGAVRAAGGAFTRRAYENRRLDLGQAEAIAELIEAESDVARVSALRVLDGDVGRTARRWREQLTDLAALLETGIDFVDEDLGDDLQHEAMNGIRALIDVFKAHIGAASALGAVRSAPEIMMIGPPNAGKSSLLNAAAGWDAAIVSSQPGTTRDLVRVALTVSGDLVYLVDSAGQHAAEDEVERLGVDRARAAAETADLRLLVVSADTLVSGLACRSQLRRGDIVFWNKSDKARPTAEQCACFEDWPVEIVCAHAPTAVDAIARSISVMLEQRPEQIASIAVAPRRREILVRALSCLTQVETSDMLRYPELASDLVRQAAKDLEGLIGVVDNEDVLSAVFSRFCIGK